VVSNSHTVLLELNPGKTIMELLPRWRDCGKLTAFHMVN
jgi:hypothetical protein